MASRKAAAHKAPQRRKVSSKRNAGFLALPLELREHIYTELTVDMPCSIFELLRVNRQLSKEAQPFLFKHPLVFHGQRDFFSWLSKIDRGNMKDITTIWFKVYEIEPAESFGALRKGIGQLKVKGGPKGGHVNHFHEACDQDAHRVGEAFKAMVNVKDFSILKTDDTEPRPDPYMLETFSRMVARRFPNLQRLSIHIDLVRLDFVSSLRQLRSLRCSGFSLSTPAETGEILSKLPKLMELEIIGPPPTLTFEQRPGYSGPRRMQSITADVIGELSSLRALTIYEKRDPMLLYPQPMFLTEATFEALKTLHKDSLQVLRIATDHDLDESEDWDGRAHLAEILPCMSLSHLEIASADEQEVTPLPRSLRRLVIPWVTATLFKTVIQRFLKNRHRVPMLKDIVVTVARSTLRKTKESPTATLSWARDQLQEVDVRLKFEKRETYVPLIYIEPEI
ncbi:MAG: hypothetical protein LQ347_006740 [Umbilicaria vellea]|nr:MAG: hypothetical protein LQ347_006740 [Umbilicaria vellea]